MFLDIEDETRTWSDDKKKEDRGSKSCHPENHLRILANDHDASTKQVMKQAQVQPKTQINNTNNTNVTKNNIQEESTQTMERLPQDVSTDKSSSKLRVFSAWSECRTNGEAESSNLKESLVTILHPLYRV